MILHLHTRDTFVIKPYLRETRIKRRLTLNNVFASIRHYEMKMHTSVDILTTSAGTKDYFLNYMPY